MTGMLGIDELSAWTRGAIPLGLSVASRAAILIALTMACHLVVGRRRALIRSATWNACLVGLLLLPLSAATFPRLRLGTPRPAAGIGIPILRSAGDVATPRRSTAPADGRPARIETTTTAPAAVAATRRDWSGAVVLAYAAVAAGLLVRLARSLLSVERLKRSGAAVESPEWAEALGRWRGRLGLARPVQMVRTRALGVPVVVGWPRPTVILPDALVDSASPATRDAVLLHELAHARRGDYAWNIVLRLVQILYWPHPLAWPLGRVVSAVREQACDDLCIAWLGGSDRYRATLVEVASGLIRRPWEALGLAMVRSSRLARRLALIDRSDGAQRCLLRAPARLAIAVAVIAAFALFGSITLTRPRADEPGKSERPQAKDQAAPPSTTRTEPRPAAPAAAPTRRVRVVRVAQGHVQRTTTQNGSLHAFESAELYPKVSGYLKVLLVDIGDRVKQGQPLAAIDEREMAKERDRAAAVLERTKQAVKQAEARVATARSDLEAGRTTVVLESAGVDHAGATRKFREKELARMKGLREQNTVGEATVDERQEKTDDAAAAERAAKAALMKAKADVDTAQRRVDQAEADLIEARANVAVAFSDLQKAQILLDNCRIISPYDGVVTTRGYHRGAFVRPPDAGNNAPLLTISRTDKFRVVTYIPDRDVPALDRGDPAEIRLDAFPGRVFRGKVARMSATLDAQTRTMRAEIDLDDPDNALRVGMFGAVTIVLDSRDGLTIPLQTICIDPGSPTGASCIRIVDGHAVPTPIRVGLEGGGRAVVLEGLKEGDAVTAQYHFDLLGTGQRVEVEEGDR